MPTILHEPRSTVDLDQVFRYSSHRMRASAFRWPSALYQRAARTLGIEEIEGELCILQEFVHGATLAQLEHRAATREPLPISLSVHVFDQVARALAYAHARGIVHRDVAPDNVMLSYSGEVKLIDFGIAKPVGDKSLTQAGFVVGRPIYTAPEVVVGGEATGSSDVYSLGVVLWQLLTGRSFPDPFEHGPAPAPALANSLVPASLDALCMKAIAPKVEDRFQSADALLAATALVGGQDLPHHPTLGEYLARHFDVKDDRRQVAADIAGARQLLVQERSGSAPEPEPVVRREPQPSSSARSKSTTLMVLAVVSTGLVVSAAVGHHFGREPREDAKRRRAAERIFPAPDPVLEANRLFKSGSFDLAIAAAARAGDAPEAHLIMGKVFLARQNVDRAAAHFRAAARLSPDDPEPKRYLDLLRQLEKTRRN